MTKVGYVWALGEAVVSLSVVLSSTTFDLSITNHIAGNVCNILKKKVMGIMDFHFWHVGTRLKKEKMEASFFGWTWLVLVYITAYCGVCCLIPETKICKSICFRILTKVWRSYAKKNKNNFFYNFVDLHFILDFNFFVGTWNWRPSAIF